MARCRVRLRGPHGGASQGPFDVCCKSSSKKVPQYRLRRDSNLQISTTSSRLHRPSRLALRPWYRELHSSLRVLCHAILLGVAGDNGAAAATLRSLLLVPRLLPPSVAPALGFPCWGGLLRRPLPPAPAAGSAVAGKSTSEAGGAGPAVGFVGAAASGSSAARMVLTRVCAGSVRASRAGTKAAPIWRSSRVPKWTPAAVPKSAPQKDASSVYEWTSPKVRQTTTREVFSFERSTLYEQPGNEKSSHPSARRVGKTRQVQRVPLLAEPSQPYAKTLCFREWPGREQAC